MAHGGSEWPVTGRDDELAAISAALDGQGGVVLAGPAGVGKTRLARSALTAQRSDQVKWILATESSRGIPLGAFLPLLGAVPKNAEDALAAAHDAVRGRDVLLAVDDAHLLDEVSATLLLHLGLDQACRMVVTVRSGELAPDAVTALWKDGVLTRLEVESISQPATTELLERVLGGQVQSTTARRLYAQTAGNLLWLRHLVDGERASGRLHRVDRMWHWVGAPRLGPALSALIDADLARLSPDLRQVLEMLALAEPLRVEVLQVLLGGDGELEACAEHGLVMVGPDGERWLARLAHPLYGEAVRAGMNAVRARRLRGRLVAALRAVGDDRDELRLAVLALDSDLPADPELFLTAANTASLLTDIELAERLSRAARDAGGGFGAQLLYGCTLSYSFRGEEAEWEYAAAERLTREDAQRLRLAQARAANVIMLLGRINDGLAMLDAVAGCPGAGTELLGIRAFLAAAGNRLEEGRANAMRALGTPGVSPSCEGYAAWALVAALALGGDGELSTAAARGAQAMLCAPETILYRPNLAWWEVLGLGLAGEVEQARRASERLTSSMSGLYPTYLRPNIDGWLALVSGRIRTAAALLAEFRPYFPGHGGGWTTLLELRLALALGMSGDAAGAREALRRADAARHPAITVVEPQFRLAEAWVAAAEAATSAAIRQARQAGAMAAESGQFAIEVMARHAAVSFGDRGQANRLGELAHRLRTPRALAAAAHAAAWAQQDPSALLASAERFARAGLMLPAAEAAAHARIVARRRLDAELAAHAARRMTDLVAACEGVRTPALRAVEQPLPISARQREIAAMVAADLSNREIADRLGLSVRTVEGHIYQACTKLGLTSRTALAELFGEGT